MKKSRVSKFASKKCCYAILSVLGISFLGATPLITSCSQGSNNTTQTNPNNNNNNNNQASNAPLPQHEPQNDSLTTTQPIIRPEALPSTNFTNYLFSQTTQLTDVAQVAYTTSIIKENLNQNFAQEMGAHLTNVTLEPDGNYSPVRYFVKLHFDKKPKAIEGFKADNGSTTTLISTTYYPSQVLSTNVSNHQFEGYTQQDLFYFNEVGTHDREISKDYYDTDLMVKYKKDGFLYPGYNCDYSLSAKDGNDKIPDGFLTLKDGQIIDAMDLVLKETPQLNDKGEAVYPGGYADGKFIKNEIKNNTFKKHPAAENFYSQDVLPTTKAVDMQFTMSTAPYGPQTLGLYAPAGEVITLQFSKEQLDKFKASDAAIEIKINDNFWDLKNRKNGSGNYETGRVSNRYPRIQSSFILDNKTWDEMTAENNYTFAFGTPFGGNISINFIKPVLSNVNALSFGDPIQFRINNAVKSLSYFDGLTTLEDWNKQIKEVMDGTISSPSIAILSSLYSANIPFTDPLHHISCSLTADQFVYPKECAKEWNDFLYLSNNFGARYQGINRLQVLDMQFCNSIWDGASAIGGGMIFYCPIEWGVGSFLKGAGSVNFDNWGTIHEINHNFEVNNAWFKLQTHPETNIVNLFDLSVISNEGRYRSEININNNSFEPDWFKHPEFWPWSKLASPFNVVRLMRQNYLDKKVVTEWAWYAAILYTIGSYNFDNFTHYAMENYPNNTPGWTPLKFIGFLSDYFKTNMWNLCRIAPRWADTNQSPWPAENDLTQNDKAIIEGLKKYPAIDFIANQYAVGQYLYNYQTQKFDYTSDITTPFEIPAIEPYNFNFENYIICNNPDFQWDTLEFTPTSKCGGTLALDPHNSKRLIYTPNPQAVNQIDEFSIKIKPTKESLQKLPANYVPGYSWKIKVRQVINRPVVQSYVPVKWQDFPTYDGFFDVLFDSMGLNGKKPIDEAKTIKVEPYSLNPMYDMNGDKPLLALTMGNTCFCKYEFNYVVPEDGQYYMWTKFEDAERVLVDGEQVYEYKSKDAWNDKKVRGYQACDQAFNWKKGEVHKIQMGIVNRTPTNWEYEKSYVDILFSNQPRTDTNESFSAVPGGKIYPITEQVLVPWVNKDNTSLELMESYLHAKEYQYKKREIDYRKYESTARKMTSNYGNLADLNTYDFVDTDNPEDKNKYARLKTDPKNYFEDWKTTGAVPDSGDEYQLIKPTAIFNTPQTMDALAFYTCGEWTKGPYIPNWYRAKVYQEDGTITDTGYVHNTNQEIDVFYIPLNKICEKVVKVELELYKTFKKGTGNILTLGQIRFCNGFNFYNAIGINDPAIKMSGELYYEPNNPLENYSNINGVYLKSNAENDVIEFTLADTQAFKILGRKDVNDGNFDVYINGNLINNYSCQSNTKEINVPIFSYINKNNDKVLKIKIVNKSQKPIYFNSLLTYGKETKLY